MKRFVAVVTAGLAAVCAVTLPTNIACGVEGELEYCESDDDCSDSPLGHDCLRITDNAPCAASDARTDCLCAVGEGEGEGEGECEELCVRTCHDLDVTLGAGQGTVIETYGDATIERDVDNDAACAALPGTGAYDFTWTLVQQSLAPDFSISDADKLAWAQSGGDPDLGGATEAQSCNGGTLVGVNVNNAPAPCDGTDDCLVFCTLCFAVVPDDIAVRFDDDGGNSSRGTCVDLSGA